MVKHSTSCTTEIKQAQLKELPFKQEFTLTNAGYKIGPRDLNVNPGHPGKLMITDMKDGEDGYAIVGDDRADLITEAYEHLVEINTSENTEFFSFCGYGNKIGMRQAVTYLEENEITVIKKIYKEGQPSFEIFGSCTEEDANKIKCEGSLVVNKAAQEEINAATAPMAAQRPRMKG